MSAACEISTFLKFHALEPKPLAAKGQSRFVNVRNQIDERNFIFEYECLKKGTPTNLSGRKKNGLGNNVLRAVELRFSIICEKNLIVRVSTFKCLQ